MVFCICFNITSLAHLAASVGSLQILQLLTHYGANFELQTFNGIRPIHDAAANGQAGTYSFIDNRKCLYKFL